jgi:hypothetical protein
VVVGEAVEGRTKGGDGKKLREEKAEKRRSDTEKEKGFRILIMT